MLPCLRIIFGIPCIDTLQFYRDTFVSTCSYNVASLVSRPVTSFSTLHAEMQEGLVCEIMCHSGTSVHNAAWPKGCFVKLTA